jgi:hypothetical protein
LGAWITAGVLGGGLVAGIAVSQLGVATAASPSPTPSASAAPDRHAGPLLRRFAHRWALRQGRPFSGRPGFPRPMGPMGPDGFAPGGRVLHGQATVQTPAGVKVVASQSGTVAGIDGDQLTVKSTDGYLRTYTVDKDTRIALNGTDGALSSLTSGDDVHVVATRAGAAWHADAVFDGMPTAPPMGATS